MISTIRNENKLSQRLFTRLWRFLQLSAMVLAASLVFSSGGGASADDGTILLNFKDTPVETVLEYLSETAGVVVVSETRLTDRITVISRKAMDIDEAVSLINTLLREKGYTAIRTGRTLKIATLTDAKKMNLPVQSGSDPEKIIPSDQVVTQIIPVRHAQAASLKENLASLVPETADFSANADTNTLIITDTTANIRRIVEIVSAIDTYMSAVAEIKVFHLVYADAEDTADLITDMFGEEQSQSSSNTANNRMQGIMQMMRGAQAQGGVPGQQQSQTASSSQSLVSAEVTAKADERTNSVVVSAPEETMTVIARMVSELDADSSEGQTLFVYPLKNARAENLVDVLNSLFGNLSTDDSDTQTTAASQGGPGSQTQQSSAPGGMQSAGAASQTSSGTAADGELSGDISVEADTDTNCLLIMTTRANYEKVKKAIAELDKPVPRVLIKVLLAEVTLDDSMDVGTEFSFLNDWAGEGEVEILTKGRLGDLSTSYLASVIDEKFEVKLRALEEQGKLNILSKPYILASNNQEATITVGSEVPFISDTRTTETGQTINTVTYEDIGIIMTVTPYINDEGLVIMDLSQEISAISGTTIPISETVNAPVFQKRSSENRVIARDGQTVVIGGLMQESKTSTVKKVPVLGSIPLLGALFRHTESDNSKTELLIFLTPKVAATDAELNKISRAAEEASGVKINLDTAPSDFEKAVSLNQSEAKKEEKK